MRKDGKGARKEKEEGIYEKSGGSERERGRNVRSHLRGREGETNGRNGWWEREGIDRSGGRGKKK